MKKTLLIVWTLLTFFSVNSFASNSLVIDFDLDSIGREVNFRSFGVNAERMFYRIQNADHQLPDEIRHDLYDAGDIIYRWPGGATANFYHFRGGSVHGYGLSRKEVESIPHPMSCNFLRDRTDYCMTFDRDSKRNFLYDFLEFADKYHKRTNKKLKTLWIPNLFTFFINDKGKIGILDSANTLEDVAEFANQGLVTQDFYDRIKDNVDVYKIMMDHPTLEVVGVEYGNEFYFHEVVTNIKYDGTNSLNSTIFREYLQDTFQIVLNSGITEYRSLVEFYNKLLFTDYPKLETSVPAALIPFTGFQPNANLIWNIALRDSLLPLVDGVVHHFYFKISNGPRINPKTAEDANMASALDSIKMLADDFIYTRLPMVDDEFDKFFNLTANNKKMWMTEFNTDNGIFDGYLAEWQNTFFHSYFQFEAFLQFIDNYHNNDVVKFAFPHLWASHWNDANYGAYSARVNPRGIHAKMKRTTYYTYEILGHLADRTLYKIKNNVVNADSLTRKDLFTSVYYEAEDSEYTPATGRIYLLFCNKSGTPIRFTPNLDIITKGSDIDSLYLGNITGKYLSAPHIYSSNGITLLDTSDELTENVSINNVTEMSADEMVELPGYSQGYIAFDINDRRKKVTVVSSTKNLSKSALDVFPNPSSTSIRISLSEKGDFNFNTSKWKVVDMSGKEHRVAGQVQSNQIQLNISQLANGMYQFIFEHRDGQATATFVKQ